MRLLYLLRVRRQTLKINRPPSQTEEQEAADLERTNVRRQTLKINRPPSQTEEQEAADLERTNVRDFYGDMFP
ncbi:hypothetical protein F2Q70_00029272 [Brassica cretica]|uniref:Uncharacterized protein n=1 Tax=Brassica cretica TaxID=69181 RepID=A0A8S9FHH3_BRACR|nr:hypothetical protein F2Q70_00029272 [Brassica cretica]